MLPYNAKFVIPNHKAIVFRNDEKCIDLWLNELAESHPDFHPFWTCVGKAHNQQELEKFVTKEDLHDVLDEAVMWFWHDMAI